MSERIRKIPYNYTSDREIVLRILGAEGWELIDTLMSGALAALRACCLRSSGTSGWSCATLT